MNNSLFVILVSFQFTIMLLLLHTSQITVYMYFIEEW